MKKYIIAIYIRLSKEDDKWKKESNSITMQRVLLKKYIEENFADYEIIEFCDDGCGSGGVRVAAEYVR